MLMITCCNPACRLHVKVSTAIYNDHKHFCCVNCIREYKLSKEGRAYFRNRIIRLDSLIAKNKSLELQEQMQRG